MGPSTGERAPSPSQGPAREGRRALRLAGLAAYASLAAAYLAWRAIHTINPQAPVYSWVFWALECYGAACAIGFYATVLDRTRRSAPPEGPRRSIDVLVCSYNESLDLVRQTLRCALAIRGPHRTWLLDDGDRPAARALAAELGCDYLSRQRNTDFKAGNLNHALAHTDAELVLVLDADHLVRPEIVERLAGYFADPAVALVQTPQVFYNVDSFQHHLRAGERRLWHEGAIFHHAMQPGADRWNAAFFVGTGAILRRSALERIGGFARGSVTEDCFTSMRLHAAGFRTVFHDEPLGYLLAPESLLQYLTQRLRWAQGSMQILRLDNPLWKRGLTLRQRLVYFMALTSFGQAAVHLAYYLAPPLFLLGGPAPVYATRVQDILVLVGHVAVDLATFRIFLGGLARPLLAECYKYLNVYAYLKALAGYFRSGRLRFQVTNKGRDGAVSLRLLGPQLAILLLNATGFGFGILQLAGAATRVDLLGLLLATSFAGFFVVVGAQSTWFAARRMAARADSAIVDDIPATVRLAGETVRAVALRANASELHLLVPVRSLPAPGAALAASLEVDDRGPLELGGRVRSVRPVPLAAGEARAGTASVLLRLELDPLSPSAVDRLFDRFAGHTMPRVVDRLVASWSRPDAADGGPAHLEPYYLPLESNVL